MSFSTESRELKLLPENIRQRLGTVANHLQAAAAGRAIHGEGRDDHMPAWLQGLARAEEKLTNMPAANKWYRELMARYPRSTEAAAASKKTGIPLPKAPPKPGTKF